MAVFTELTQTEIANCIAPYGLVLESYEGIAEGTQNTLCRVTANNQEWLLTLFEPPLANDDLDWFLRIHRELNKADIPCPAPKPDIHGNLLRYHEGKPYCLFPFIQGKHPIPTTAQAHEVGIHLARLHLCQIAVATKKNVWDIGTMQQVAAKLNGSNWPEALSIARAALSVIQTRHLPSGLIHADLFPDNTLFIGDKLNGLIDFFFACHDAYAYDLAITLSSWSFNAQNRHLPDIENAILQGYQQVRPLTTDEHQALPQLLELACVRFFLSRLKAYEAAIPQKMGALRDPGVYAARLKHYQKQAQ